MNSVLRGVLLGGVAAAVAGAPALAQSSFDRDRNVSVRDRVKPEYEVSGLPLGAFRLLPEVAAGVEYNDNIYGAGNNEVDDFIGTLDASVSLVSGWSRHALTLGAFANHDEYFDNDDESHTDWGVNAAGRLDASYRTQLDGSAAYSELYEPRTASASPASADEPIQYDLATADVAVTHTLNRVQLGARAEWRDYDYHDTQTPGGVVIDQDDRDRVITGAGARVAYAVSPDTALFIDGSVNDRDYDLEAPAAGLDRDSDGYRILAGANFDLTRLVRGEIGVGYMEQRYEDPALSNIDGLSLLGELEWFPTQLTTFTFNASRVVEDSAIIGSAGYISTTVGARVDHELLRPLILGAEFSYSLDDYKGIFREDERYFGQFDVTYLVNRYVGLRAYYSVLDQDSTGTIPGADFTVNRFGANLVLRR